MYFHLTLKITLQEMQSKGTITSNSELSKLSMFKIIRYTGIWVLTSKSVHFFFGSLYNAFASLTKINPSLGN